MRTTIFFLLFLSIVHISKGNIDSLLLDLENHNTLDSLTLVEKQLNVSSNIYYKNKDIADSLLFAASEILKRHAEDDLFVVSELMAANRIENDNEKFLAYEKLDSIATARNVSPICRMDIDDIEIDIDTIVPLGLIINELITNSLKYAWPNNNEGTLHIELKKTESQIVLTVKDDGIGYDPTSVRKDSFGATLISALTLQLERECTVNTDNGSMIVITLDSNIR